MRNLLSLPAELLASILSYLDAYDLLNCSASTKQLSRLISTSSKLQYTISLAKHKLLSILPESHPHPPYATRLKVLREREKAWRELEWRGKRQLKLPPTGSVYEFVGGIYGNGREDESRVTASISFLELPGLSEGEFEAAGSRRDKDTRKEDSSSGGLGKGKWGNRKLRTWTHAMGNVAIIDFTMDPSQDLLVLVALAPADSKHIYNLHLRTISTNEPHPKAPLPILSCLERHPTIPPPPELFAAVRVQVSGDLVGLLIKEAPDPVGAHLEVWNWDNDPYYSCSMTSPHGIDDFTFLSHSSFLIVLPVGRFEVYTFPDPLTSPLPSASSTFAPTLPVSSALQSPSLGTCTRSSSYKKGCKPTRKYSYDFPELSPGYMYWYISMSCNPAPGYVPSQGTRAKDPFPPLSSSCYDSPYPFAGTDRDGDQSEEIGSDIVGSVGVDFSKSDSSASSGETDEAANQQLYYPLPDERIHACCIYIFNPNNHTNLAANNLNNTTTTAITATAAPSSLTATSSNASSSANINGAASMTSSNSSNTNNNHNDDGFMDDDLDEENQQVHSFVFFLNLKTLLNPPDEWFDKTEPIHDASSVTNGHAESSPFAALASKLGPLWKSSPSPGPTFPASSDTNHQNFGSSSASASGSLSTNGATPNSGEISGAATLESSLNALKRRQEEKELKDAKAALDAHANVNAKKKRKGGSSSSLSVEIPLYGPSTSEGAVSLRSPLAKSKSNLSSPKPSGSSSSGPAYPPFPTFSSPFASSPSGSKNTNAGPSGSGGSGLNAWSSSRASATGSSGRSFSFGLNSFSSSDADTTMIPLIPPPKSPRSSLFEAGTNTRVNETRSAPRHPSSSSSNKPSSYSPGSVITLNSAFSSSAPMVPSAAPPSASASTSISSASPSKTRSASTPPTYNSIHSQSQINYRSSAIISSPSLPHSPTASSSASAFTSSSLSHLTQSSKQNQIQDRHNHHRSTSPRHARTNTRNTSLPIPWDVWGPSTTRWFEECLSTDWQHAIYGLRTVESVSMREREEERERQRLIAEMKELELIKERQLAEIKRLEKESERLEIESQRLELQVMSNAGLLLGKKKRVEKMKAEEARGKKPVTQRQLQKEREVELILKAIVDSGVWKKKKRKGKGKKRALERGVDKDMVREMTGGAKTEEAHSGDATRSEELNYAERITAGKEEPSPSTSYDVLNEDGAAFHAKSFMKHLKSPSPRHYAFDECEQDDTPSFEATTLTSDGGYDSDSIPTAEGSLEPQSDSVGAGSETQASIHLNRKRPRRYLRVRDFNPYSLKLAEAEAEAEVRTLAHVSGVHTDSMASSSIGKGKGKQRALPSPSPPPSSHSYSYPYPIHLSYNPSPPLPSTHASRSSASFPSSKYLAKPDFHTNFGSGSPTSKALGKKRVVREPSITPVKAVFKKDIVSWLPYTEVVSEETFEVTDVMMDDSRLLLLKVR